MSLSIYADTQHRQYMRALEKELEACMNLIADAADKLATKPWDPEMELRLNVNHTEAKKIKAELVRLDRVDPVEWLKAMNEGRDMTEEEIEA